MADLAIYAPVGTRILVCRARDFHSASSPQVAAEHIMINAEIVEQGDIHRESLVLLDLPDGDYFVRARHAENLQRWAHERGDAAEYKLTADTVVSVSDGMTRILLNYVADDLYAPADRRDRGVVGGFAYEVWGWAWSWWWRR